MGYSFEFDAANNTIRCSLEGRVTEEGAMSVFSSFVRFNASHPPCRGIVDFSKVTSEDLSNKVVRKLASMPVFSSAQLMHVFVARRDVDHSLVRMFSMLIEEKRPNLGVVRTMDEAFRLLGIDSPQFSRTSID